MDQLFRRSSLLLQNALELINHPLYNDSQRTVASADACQLAIDHGGALRSLLEGRFGTSAPAMLRCQFEALTRSLWLLHCATDEQVEFIMTTAMEGMTSEARLPMATDMMRQLRQVPVVAHPLELLDELKASGWMAMNSYVHGGVHAMQRTREGFPTELAIAILKLSNGLSMLAVMQLAALTGVPKLQRLLLPLNDAYGDCLPIKTRASSSSHAQG